MPRRVLADDAQLLLICRHSFYADTSSDVLDWKGNAGIFIGITPPPSAGQTLAIAGQLPPGQGIKIQ